MRANDNHQTRFNIICLVGILLLAAGLRYYGIEREGLWTDELFAVVLGLLNPHFQNIFPQLLSDSHPPGFVSFMYFYSQWFRDSEFEIRLPSFIAGVALVYLVYLFAKRYLSASAGLIAALLTAVSYQSIYYSQEARAYAMLSLTCLASFYYFLPLILHQTINRKDFIGFVVSTTLALYLHYAGFVFFACEGLIFLFALIVGSNRIRLIKQGIKILLPPLLLYSPWLPVMFKHMTDIPYYWGGSIKPDFSKLTYLARFLLGPDIQTTCAYFAALIFCFFIAIKLFISSKKDGRITDKPIVLLSIIFMAIAPIAVFYIKSQFSQVVFQNRHFVPSIAFFALLGGETLFFIPNRISHILVRNIILSLIIVTSAVIFIWRNNAYLLYQATTKDPWRESVEVIQADKEFMSRKNPLVMHAHPWVDYYLWRAGLNLFQDTNAAYQYDELRDALIKEGEFYFVTFTPSEQYPFYTRLFEDFNLVCLQRVLNWQSGMLNVMKFERKGSETIKTTTPLCAPDLQFNFVVPYQYN